MRFGHIISQYGLCCLLSATIYLYLVYLKFIASKVPEAPTILLQNVSGCAPMYPFSAEQLKPSLCMNLNVKGCSGFHFLHSYTAIRIFVQNVQDEPLFSLLAQGCKIPTSWMNSCLFRSLRRLANYQAVILLHTLLVKWFYFAWYTEVVSHKDRESRGCVPQSSSWDWVTKTQLPNSCILANICNFVILFSAAIFGRKEWIFLLKNKRKKIVP